ncbi:4Fe-4S binding protein [Parabacteroides sp. PF5-9]|uniref:4Fe-4S binding protein n=1 Tax=Parabacteroides sp. PF5-9 TaxID=1742404 RepID=UPI002473BC27|nr:4Fe-4S binding protein [Parabacteroides sp. PF5-9]MDH6358478.1 NosR/NirI family nitrous oxide reductase transcriptional regulator [Parabacteroides sp. PF5-9]
MKRQLYIWMSLLLTVVAKAQNRFPKPDFESGYQYPDLQYPVPNETLWTVIDIVLLVVLMGIVAWAVIRKRTRKPVVWVSIISVAYFGFYRSGCICSIGSIQNVSLALVDNTYILPVSVLLFFILPVLFAFLFGRVFCAGVCPFGALQELVNIKSYRLSRTVTTVLGLIPWLYLIFAVLYAVTRSSFIICRFDPFIGIFRLGGDIGLIVFGAALLLLSIFVGRPFCRFICPYGALLSLFSRVSIWKVEITKSPCINCELCHNACPVDAIKAPYDNKVKESRMDGVKRILAYAVVLPLMILAGAILMRMASSELSRANKDVRLYDMVMEYETEPMDVLPLELEAFYGQGKSIEELTQKYESIQDDFKLYSTIAGGFIGLVIGMALIGLSLKRTRKLYEIDHAACVDCGRCFSYCPQNTGQSPVFKIPDSTFKVDKTANNLEP